MGRKIFTRGAVAGLWQEGLISGEMHLGIGEEGINAGVLDHLGDGDAVALDHRGTAGMLLHGVDAAAIIKECMGIEDGLCGGMGGHMHMFSKDHLAASSGIVGSSGPAACGFALMERTGCLLVVDDDYRDFGLTGELAAAVLESGLPARYARVAVEGTIPFDPVRERAALPNVDRICEAVRGLMK